MTVPVLDAVRYLHCKGGVYRVLSIARDANADELHTVQFDPPSQGWGPRPMGERWVVVYQAENAPLGEPNVWVRTYRDFMGLLPDGRRRFTPMEVSHD